MKRPPSIFCLLAVAAFAPSCHVPKAIVVREPLKKNSQTAMQETTGAPSLPGRNGDMPRVPDMLNQLPDERDFQPTNPSVTNNASSDGAVVAKPPSSTPPRNKGENPQP